MRVDPYGRVREVTDVFAAGDATDFAVKHGGLSSQQADAVAQSIAAQAGAQLTPQAFDPLIRGMLLTGGKPLYMQAHIAGGHGFSSEASETPLWAPVGKISARYLTPYLDALDAERSDVTAGPTPARAPERASARRSAGGLPAQRAGTGWAGRARTGSAQSARTGSAGRTGTGWAQSARTGSAGRTGAGWAQSARTGSAGRTGAGWAGRA